MNVVDVDTPAGPARAHLHPVDGPRAALVLGHGAGGGVTAPDLVAATAAAHKALVSVALVEQPYRVAGRRSPPPAATLDAAWLAVVARLGERELRGLRLLAGGRSSGARVACRTADAVGAAGVLCLSFPLQPPRREGKPQAASRLGELDAVTVPTLVVQGRNDPFGIPPAGPCRTVVEIGADHGLKSDLPAAREAIGAWLDLVVGTR